MKEWPIGSPFVEAMYICVTGEAEATKEVIIIFFLENDSMLRAVSRLSPTKISR